MSDTSRRRPGRATHTRITRPLAVLVIAVAAWWAATAAYDVHPFFLPAPPDILDAYTRLGPYLLKQTALTVGHLLIGFGFAVAGGLAIALLVSAVPWLGDGVMPWIVAFNGIPKVAVWPLLTLWLGLELTPKIVLVTAMCFFPVLAATAAGLRSTPTELVELATSMCASRWQTYVKLRLWWALPQTFTGVKIAMTLAAIGVVVAEFQAPDAGLGAVIVRSGANVDTPMVFAALLLLSAVALGLYYTIVAVEWLTLPWARQTTA